MATDVFKLGSCEGPIAVRDYGNRAMTIADRRSLDVCQQTKRHDAKSSTLYLLHILATDLLFLTFDYNARTSSIDLLLLRGAFKM